MDVAKQKNLLATIEDIVPFKKRLRDAGFDPFTAIDIEILQMNITRRCNLSCKHCHVEAGPGRTEMMSREILEKCLLLAQRHSISTIDITGGAPEMHPDLQWFLEQATRFVERLIVRSNLLILLDEACRHFIDIFAHSKVELVGSLPDYRKERSERQRGEKTFEKALEAIRILNERGYGIEGSGLILDLVHNPSGAYLPGSQKALEKEYHDQLAKNNGIFFNRLFVLTNCPVGRYLEYLNNTDNLVDYLQELQNAFNPTAAKQVMCRTTLSVGWDGTLYDCDFNQMLELSTDHGAPNHILNFDQAKLSTRQIEVGNHCYCCTAGAGSSCQGSLES
ncbi:MAG: arsenosugar biosynthesis radical SAM protein ArsS [Desulfosarcinaceae bacterium]